MAEELLSPAELETLLAGGNSGTGSKASRAVPSEISALHAEALRAATSGPQRRPGSPQADPRMTTLLARHESFSRKLSSALSAWLRMIVEVRMASAEPRTYSEVLQQTERPAYCQLLRAVPLAVPWLFDVPLPILYVVLDRMLGGGRNASVVVRRAPTDIELRLAARFTALVLTELNAAWQGLVDLQLAAERVETDPHLLRELPPGGRVLLFSLEIRLNDTRGTLRLAVPWEAVDATVEPVIVPMSPHVASDAPPSPGTAAQPAPPAPADGSVELEACLAETTIAAKDLIHLQPGDILATEQPADSLVWIYAAGKLAYRARLGCYQGRKAVQIEEVADSASDDLPKRTAS